MNFKNEIDEYIKLEVSILEKLDRDVISKVINILIDALDKERNIYIFGNGGSASTASHFQNDFNKGISFYTKKKFRFLCLSDNISTLTAIANDVSYEEVFREQLRGRITEEDIAIAISGSGNSKNVLNALIYAKAQGALTVGFSGYTGGGLGKLCDVHVNVPVENMQITEDVHMMLAHMMMSIIYQYFCKGGGVIFKWLRYWLQVQQGLSDHSLLTNYGRMVKRWSC